MKQNVLVQHASFPHNRHRRAFGLPTIITRAVNTPPLFDDIQFNRQSSIRGHRLRPLPAL